MNHLYAALEDLRKRNGELATALAEIDPEHPVLGRPIGKVYASKLNDLHRAALVGDPDEILMVAGLVREHEAEAAWQAARRAERGRKAIEKRWVEDA